MSDGVGEQRLRVMVVDDHPTWGDAMESHPEEAGFDVAVDGPQGIARFRRHGRRSSSWTSRSQVPAVSR